VAVKVFPDGYLELVCDDKSRTVSF